MISNDRAEASRFEPSKDEAPLLSWRVCLWRKSPWRGAGAIFGLLCLTALLWSIMGPAGALLLGSALLFSVASFFLPQEYALFQRGLQVRQGLRWRTFLWSDFQGAYRASNAIKLSPFPEAHPLERWRSLVLFLDRNEQQVWSMVCALMEAHIEGSETPQGNCTSGGERSCEE